MMILRHYSFYFCSTWLTTYNNNKNNNDNNNESALNILVRGEAEKKFIYGPVLKQQK